MYYYYPCTPYSQWGYLIYLVCRQDWAELYCTAACLLHSHNEAACRVWRGGGVDYICSPLGTSVEADAENLHRKVQENISQTRVVYMCTLFTSPSLTYCTAQQNTSRVWRAGDNTGGGKKCVAIYMHLSRICLTVRANRMSYFIAIYIWG